MTFASELNKQIKKDQVALSKGVTKSDLLKRCEAIEVKYNQIKKELRWRR